MRWKVYYTEDAKDDLQNIYQYISCSLHSPETAKKQTNHLMDAVDSLDQMPLRFRLYDKEPWKSKGLRFLVVDNYLIFYLPEEAQGSVSIIRIMYGGRDIENQLKSSDCTAPVDFLRQG